MIKRIFLSVTLVTLAVNLILLVTTRSKPPDIEDSAFDDAAQVSESTSSHANQRRLFLRSNDFYSDYSSVTLAPRDIDQEAQINSSSPRDVSQALKVDTSADTSATIVAPSSGHTNINNNHNNLYTSSSRELAEPNRFAHRDGSSSYALFNTSPSKANNKPESIRRPNGFSAWKISQSREKQAIDDSSSGRLTDNLMNSESAIRTIRSKIENIKNASWSNGSGDSKDGLTITNILNKSISAARLSHEQTVEPTEATLASSEPEPELDKSTAGSLFRSNRVQVQMQADSRDTDTQMILKQSLANKRLAIGAEAEAEPNVINVDGRNDVSSGPARWLKIRVKSSKNHVFVSVDDIVIYESKAAEVLPSSSGQSVQMQASSASLHRSRQDESDDEHGRGIHLVVLNQFNGDVMSKRVFDTYTPGQDDELCFFLNMIKEGRIIILSVRDEASFKMPVHSSARKLLQRLGSEHIMSLRWRDMWAFAGRKQTILETGSRIGDSRAQLASAARQESKLAEALSKSGQFSDWGPPVIVETRVKLADYKQADDYECRRAWRSSNQSEFEMRRRVEFCAKVEGYGHVCDCSFPAPISFTPNKIDYSMLEQVPIVVMASNRPHYLQRMLRSLLSADGVDPSMVTIFIDGFYDEPALVGQLFNIRTIQQRPTAHRGARISHHYKTSLTKTFQLFPDAEFALIFEEDLDIAEDALVYFNQTLQLLRDDPSLLCVSAWNDQGYEHTARDNRLLYRIETMPGLGWMLKRALYKQELEPNWPSPERPHDWDMWIRMDSVRRGRECIIPDVSRTFHFGSTGTNINSYFQKQYFSKHAFNLSPLKSPQRFADLQAMSHDAYERLIETQILGAQVVGLEADEYSAHGVNVTDYLCSLANTDSHELLSSLSVRNLTQPPSPKPDDANYKRHSVIYIEMIDKQDYTNWLRLASCWRIWDLDARGQHKSMWRLFLNMRPTFVVGVPASPYSSLKPDNLKPFKLSR